MLYVRLISDCPFVWQGGARTTNLLFERLELFFFLRPVLFYLLLCFSTGILNTLRSVWMWLERSEGGGLVIAAEAYILEL
jgi:hypothetical protein